MNNFSLYIVTFFTGKYMSGKVLRQKPEHSSLDYTLYVACSCVVLINKWSNFKRNKYAQSSRVEKRKKRLAEHFITLLRVCARRDLLENRPTEKERELLINGRAVRPKGYVCVRVFCGCAVNYTLFMSTRWHLLSAGNPFNQMKSQQTMRRGNLSIVWQLEKLMQNAEDKGSPWQLIKYHFGCIDAVIWKLSCLKFKLLELRSSNYY